MPEHSHYVFSTNVVICTQFLEHILVRAPFPYQRKFSPRPVSTLRWCGAGGFAQRKCIMDIAVTRWFDENFPPLAIYHGGCDLLVATKPLLSRIDTQEPHVKVIRVEKLEKSEVSHRLLSDHPFAVYLYQYRRSSIVISILRVSSLLPVSLYLYNNPFTS